MRSSVIHATLVVIAVAAALAVGAACKGPDSPDTTLQDFSGIASGFNLTHASCTATPPTANCGKDTSASATVTIHWGGGTTTSASNTYTYTLNVTSYPSTGITTVVMRSGTGAASTLGGTLCSAATTPACPAAAGSISGTITGVTDTTYYRTLRNRGSYARISTTGEATGSMLGNLGPVSP